MRRIVVLSVVMLLAVAVVASVLASEAKSVTLEGKVLCAKCSMHKQDECQNVLMVANKGEKGGEEAYYLKKNATYEKFGEVCEGTRPVRVTGEIEKQEDGRLWLVATKIEPVEK